jgi:hypothetical protein
MRAVFLIAVLMLSPASVTAQQLEPIRLPSPEFGVGISVPFVLECDCSAFENAEQLIDLRVTAPITPRFSFDAIVALRPSTGYGDRSNLFLLLIKQRIVDETRGRFHAFASYGLAGLFSARDFIPPALTVFGFGYQYEFGNRTAVRAEVQGVTFLIYPVGARVAVGVSIPFER